MSFPSDCSACVRGCHDEHNAVEGVKPGVIGGTVCVCRGDCAERIAPAVALLKAIFERTDRSETWPVSDE